MSDVIDFPQGGFRFARGVFQYSAAVAALRIASWPEWQPSPSPVVAASLIAGAEAASGRG